MPSMAHVPGSTRFMEIQKVFTYVATAIAGLIGLIFLLDAALGVLGRNLVLDVLFIIAAAFVVWQGGETAQELPGGLTASGSVPGVSPEKKGTRTAADEAD